MSTSSAFGGMMATSHIPENVFIYHTYGHIATSHVSRQFQLNQNEVAIHISKLKWECLHLNRTLHREHGDIHSEEYRQTGDHSSQNDRREKNLAPMY